MPTNNDEELKAANAAVIDGWRDYMDLSVVLAVELGRTKLPVREILSLELDNIIQLSRSTGEGVDVLAGEHRLGRGQIIMIEDRTGVRINEVMQQEDV